VLLSVAGLFFISIGALWLHETEPWYDNTLVQRMMGGYHSWRDDSGRIADVFPAGMRSDDAFQLLRRNGFSCTASDTQINCMRQINRALVCGGQFDINVSFDAANFVTTRTAKSYFMCP
jgi:hypothetical protein